jgi:hypothetical protein
MKTDKNCPVSSIKHEYKHIKVDSQIGTNQLLVWCAPIKDWCCLIARLVRTDLRIGADQLLVWCAPIKDWCCLEWLQVFPRVAARS